MVRTLPNSGTEETSMFNRILVPTDFSKPSDAALAHAKRLAANTGATLHLLHVVDNLFLRAVLGDPHDYEAAALRQLRDRAPAPTGDIASILAVERSDEPADEITSYARTHGIDLIVMGTHGRGRMAHLLLGSVAEKVSRTSPCPVLTLRDAPQTEELKGVRILVPTDFGPSADAALGCARRLAARLRGSVCLLHVIEHPGIGASFGSELYVPEPAAVRQEQVAKAKIQLSRRILVDSRSRVKVTSDIVFGPSSTMIAAYAHDSGFDLIVMGTRGRGGLAHLLIGSVAESVIRTASCPVLTVKARETATAAQTAEAAAACAV
jgi:nucleotide-binding universal stress UspA family protein